jgi:hypothetical protein
VTDELPTKQQLAWAGKVWDSCLRREAEGVAWTTFGYMGMVDALGTQTWEQIGSAHQLEITKVMLRLEQYFQKGHR